MKRFCCRIDKRSPVCDGHPTYSLAITKRSGKDSARKNRKDQTEDKSEHTVTGLSEHKLSENTVHVWNELKDVANFS